MLLAVFTNVTFKGGNLFCLWEKTSKIRHCAVAHILGRLTGGSQNVDINTRRSHICAEDKKERMQIQGYCAGTCRSKKRERDTHRAVNKPSKPINEYPSKPVMRSVETG